MLPYSFQPPSEQDSVAAREATAKIIPFMREHQPLTLRVVDAGQHEPIVLPAGSLPLLKIILEAMAAGHGMTLIPQHAELTTMEAADILNVSRPYLIKLLENHEIPFHKVGRHRRVRLDDILGYKERIDREREAILDQMVAEAQELGLYD